MVRRPADGNVHRLSFVTERPKRLLLELDDQLLLAFSGDVKVERCVSTRVLASGTLGLSFTGFSQLVLDRLAYGSDEPHVEAFSTGSVCLIAPTREPAP